jgi:hypothetical protein
MVKEESFGKGGKKMKIKCFFVMCLFVFLLQNSIVLGSTLAAPKTSRTDIIANGTVGIDEWSDAAGIQDDLGASAGYIYSMWSENYTAGSVTYSGTFNYLLHNIEQSTTAEDADYNVFDVYSNDTVRLRIWVFNGADEADDSTWLSAAGLNSYYATIDDRGFLVYNYGLNTYAQWLPEYISPEDGGYSWDAYWGVYAAGGFDNSAYEAGLTGSYDNDNELYEVIYKLAGSTTIKRSILDPDKGIPSNPLIPFCDNLEITFVPEPVTTVLVLQGLGGFALMRKRRVL